MDKLNSLNNHCLAKFWPKKAYIRVNIFVVLYRLILKASVLVQEFQGIYPQAINLLLVKPELDDLLNLNKVEMKYWSLKPVDCFLSAKIYFDLALNVLVSVVQVRLLFEKLMQVPFFAILIELPSRIFKLAELEKKPNSE